MLSLIKLKIFEINKHQVWIDAAKGMSVLLVLLAHPGFGIFVKEYHEIRLIAYIINISQASFMPLLYVLFGYTFKERPDIIKQRFKRLLYPYILSGEQHC